VKIELLDAHDRLQQLNTQQSLDISECCQDLIRKRPFGNTPFYIFAHARTDEDGTTKRLIWQPRLTKPKAQTNSMLFKGYPGSDEIKVLWMIPERSMWTQFEKGKLTESKVVMDSIYDFEHDRGKLEAPEDDDLTDEQINKIYESIGRGAKFEKSGFSLL
jgi:hypothetical protein